MILEDKERLDALLPYMPPRLARALAWLRDADFDRLADGEYEIDGRDIYAKVRAGLTGSKRENRPETHERYIDIQYIISGREIICCEPLRDGHLIAETRRADDLVVYANALNEADYLMKAGQLMVIFPWEVHRGSCHADGQAGRIRKVVIKVRADG